MGRAGLRRTEGGEGTIQRLYRTEIVYRTGFVQEEGGEGRGGLLVFAVQNPYANTSPNSSFDQLESYRCAEYGVGLKLYRTNGGGSIGRRKNSTSFRFKFILPARSK